METRLAHHSSQVSVVWLAALVLGTGLVALVGWGWDLTLLKSVRHDLVSMKPNAAVALALVGVALPLLALQRSARARRLGVALGVLVSLIGLATLFEYLSGVGLGIDEVLFRDDRGAPHTSHPGRMAPTTAFALSLMGVAIVLAGRRRRRAQVVARALAGVAALIAYAILASYVHGVPPPAGLERFTWMAVHTAIGLLGGCWAVLALEPGAVGSAEKGGAGLGAPARFVIAAALVPLLVAWVVFGWPGEAGPEARFPLFTLATALVYGVLVGWAALSLHHRETRSARAEESLRNTEARLEFLSRTNLIGVVSLDREWRILDANDVLLRMLGLDRARTCGGRKLWDDVAAPGFVEAAARAASQARAGGPVTPWETELTRRDGSRFPVLVGIASVATDRDERIAFVLDVSEQRRLEEHLRQAQRMETVGRLAGGVAHDFNNLLTPILSYCDLVLKRVGADAPWREDLLEIQRAGERAAALTRQLLAFSRKQVLQPSVVDLGALVSDATRLLRRTLGEDVELVVGLAPSLGRVFVDPGQIEQVLMNLAVNARDAMPRGGTLTVETSNVDLDEEYARSHSEVTPGPHVLLSVSDTGTGMTREVLDHLFEPFFTTKEPGRGTGLGLATVHGIVKQSRGHIWVYSEPGRGTTFKVYLPVAPGAPTPARAAAPGKEPVARGAETVLVVEDDGPLRALVVRVLRALGYEVLEAPEGASALALSRSDTAAIDLLLTDVVMPGLGGRELAEQLRASRPRLRVLYMSGYTEDAIVHHGVLDPGVELLEKPFTPAVLARRVRAALDAEEPR